MIWRDGDHRPPNPRIRNMKILLPALALMLLLTGCDADSGTVNRSPQPSAQTAGTGAGGTLSGAGLGGPGGTGSSSAGSAGGLGGGRAGGGGGAGGR